MALFLQVNQSTGGSHDDVDASPQFLHLAFLIHSAKNCGCVELHVLRILEDIFLNLDSQFTGRCKDQSADGLKLAGVAVLGKPMNHRQAESCCLTGTSLRYAQDIFSFQYNWNGFGLDGRWSFITQRMNGREHICAEA